MGVKMKENNKFLSFFKDTLLSTLFAVLISVLLALVLALIIKFVDINDTFLTVINQAIKIFSILFGLMLGIKHATNGAAKGAIVGLLYALITALMFSLLEKSAFGKVFDWVDMLFSIAIGGISGILAVNIKSK